MAQRQFQQRHPWGTVASKFWRCPFKKGGKKIEFLVTTSVVKLLTSLHPAVCKLVDSGLFQHGSLLLLASSWAVLALIKVIQSEVQIPGMCGACSRSLGFLSFNLSHYCCVELLMKNTVLVGMLGRCEWTPPCQRQDGDNVFSFCWIQMFFRKQICWMLQFWGCKQLVSISLCIFFFLQGVW